MVKIKNSYFELLLNKKDLIGKIKGKELTSSVSYWINKGLKTATAESENYFNEKTKLINKYAVKGPDGNVVVSGDGGVTIPNEHITELNSGLLELMDIEIELNDLKKVDINYEDKNMPAISGDEQDLIEPFVNDITGK